MGRFSLRAMCTCGLQPSRARMMSATIAPQSSIASRAGVVDEDRNEIQCAVKDRRSPLLAPLAEFVPAGAIDERCCLKDHHGTLDRQFEPFVPIARILVALGAKL